MKNAQTEVSLSRRAKRKLRNRMGMLLGLVVMTGPAVLAQNTSYNIDAIPIGGMNSCAFGMQSLFMNNGNNNTAAGFNSMFTNNPGNDNSGFGAYVLYNNKTGNSNSAFGMEALFTNTSGDENTAHGYQALYSTTVSGSTATGYRAMYSNTTGGGNSAFGHQGLFSNTTGSENTAIGNDALYTNTTGYRNIAIGNRALYGNTTGTENIGIGWWALMNNTTGIDNTAIGLVSQMNNTTGWYNASVGYGTLLSNTTGDNNTAMGTASLWNNTTGTQNSALGRGALGSNTTGYYNTASGAFAMSATTTGYSNTSAGYFSLLTNTTGTNNTAVGFAADVQTNNLSNAMALGNGAIVTTSNTTFIGDGAMTATFCAAGTYTVSDGRFKTNVREEVKGLDFITKLRPVVYNFEGRRFEEFLTQSMPDSVRKLHLDKDFEPATVIRQTGFIAQEVARAAEESGYDFNGVRKPMSEKENYSLNYAQFVVPLVKAVQEQQDMIRKQEEMIARQEKTNMTLQQQVDELRARIGIVPDQGVIKGSSQHVILGDNNTIVLDQNEPNPFAESTVIAWNIPSDFGKAQLIFTRTDGKVIRTVDITDKGKGSVNVYAGDLTTGIYKYVLVVDGKTIDAKTMIKE